MNRNEQVLETRIVTSFLFRYERWNSILPIALFVGFFMLLAVASSLAGEYPFTDAQTKCAANLKRLSAGIEAYRGDHEGRYPPWLSCLYPEYIRDKVTFICPSDQSHGAEGAKPDNLHRELGRKAWCVLQYRETDDVPRPGITNYCGRNDRIEACSYLYELCAAKYSLALDGIITRMTDGKASADAVEGSSPTWGDVKLRQLESGTYQIGNSTSRIDKARFPIVRCFHHNADGIFEVRDEWTGEAGRGAMRMQGLTLNLPFQGAVYLAPFAWEAGTNFIRRVK